MCESASEWAAGPETDQAVRRATFGGPLPRRLPHYSTSLWHALHLVEWMLETEMICYFSLMAWDPRYHPDGRVTCTLQWGTSDAEHGGQSEVDVCAAEAGAGSPYALAICRAVLGYTEADGTPLTKAQVLAMLERGAG